MNTPGKTITYDPTANNREQARHDVAVQAMAAVLSREGTPYGEESDSELASAAYDVAEAMILERDRRSAADPVEHAKRQALMKLGQACVDYADDTDDCPICDGNAAHGTHDEECPLAKFLDAFDAPRDEPIPYRPATNPPAAWTGHDELEQASTNEDAGLAAPGGGS